MYKLKYLPIAKQDIENIVKYICYNLKNKKAAKNIADLFLKKANDILKFPYGISEYKTPKKLKYKYRIVKVKQFYMFYIIDEETKTIIIARVIHKNRNINTLLK